VNHAQQTALGRALRVLGEHGEALNANTSDGVLYEMRADLRRALDLLEECVSSEVPSTRCREHPNGPVDADAPDKCLLCETRRRTARRSQVNGPFPRGRSASPEDSVERTHSRYGIRADRPQPQQRWLPEMWTGQTWQLCGTPRRDRHEAEQFLAAQRRGSRPALAYRLVHEFTDYEVLRIWGEPVRVDIEPLGNV